MDQLLEIVLEIIASNPPERSSQLAQEIARLTSSADADRLITSAINPNARGRIVRLSAAWKAVNLGPSELAGMLIGASAAHLRARNQQDVELIWTGPGSQLVATRKTEQGLLEVIGSATARLFITSFVTYNIPTIMVSLDEAIARGVNISLLLEASEADGGGVSIDGIRKMKSLLPAVRVFSWKNKGDQYVGGKVHAKVAVADDRFCFISSANLTGHAMEKNMEAGVLIKGGALPHDLHRHLEALVTTQVITEV